jgi:hypothetical protein
MKMFLPLFVFFICFLLSLKRLKKIREMKIEAGAIKQTEFGL